MGLASASLLINCNSHAQYADQVISYSSGAGVSPGYSEPSRALGAPTTFIGYQDADPFNPPYRTNDLVSVGPGGSLTVQFNLPIQNDPNHPFGLDFIIFGNAGFVITNGDFSGGGVTDGSLFGNNTGSTRISVSTDNVNFYVLNPALAPVGDGLYPRDASGNAHIPVNPALGSRDFAGKDLAGIRGLFGASGGGTGYDISWAQDTNGQSVFLSSISFIRVDVLSGKADLDAFAAVSGAASISENFLSDPTAHGWRIYGETNLFSWNSTNQNLQVTWDSTKSNSYFFHPLNTILTAADTFSLGFDIQILDVTNHGAFEAGIGFLNLVNATATNFYRGTGTDSPNLVEYDYFPPFDTFLPTLAQAIVSTNGAFLYNHNNLLNLTPGVWFHVEMFYDSMVRRLTTTTSEGGQVYGSVQVISVPTNFDFRVGAISISSYSDQKADGSILAHGLIDNVTATLPTRPVENVAGVFTNQIWEVHFASLTNWVYTLERTVDLKAWAPAGMSVAGNGGSMTLQDTNSPAINAFYRVRAEQ